jgi:type I restriction enzyme S subunit
VAIQDGFKMTEVGMIPSDWDYAVFGNLVYICRGGSPRPIDAYITSNPSGINWIKIGDVAEGDKYITSTKERIIPEGKKSSREVHSGDFILSNSMSFGRPYILKIDGCIHDGWLAIQNYQDTFDTNFLYYLLSSENVYAQYVSMAAGSSVQNLNKEKVAAVKLSFPSSKKEQQRIANALSDVDTLIESLEKLIAKKKNIKQGAMQQLLTGRKRLPGFGLDERTGSRPTDEKRKEKKGNRHCSSNHDCCDLPMREQVPVQSNLARHCERSEAIQSSYKMTELGLMPIDWEVKPFKGVATLINGRAYSQDELLERGKYRVLRVGNFGTNDSWYYSNLELPEKMYCNKGDLLYCWSCTYGAYIWDEEKTIYHYHIWKIADLKAEKRYLQYILNNDVVQQMNSSNGSTMSHITKGILENRLFAFPPTIEEQTAIANILSDMDTEISALETKLAKYRTLKTGMMQQLLTGKIRLV